MALLASQTELVDFAIGKLQKRKMVFFQGKANSKTTAINGLLYKVCKEVAKPREKGVELLHVAHFRNPPRSDKMSITSFQRLILEYFDYDYHGNILAVERNFEEMLIEMNKQRQAPLLAFDNIELYSKRFFHVLKSLNEYTVPSIDKKLGCAIVLGGDVLRSKMPPPIYEKCSEITVERIERISEIRELIELACPDEMHLFTTPALEQLKRCQTVQQMVRSVEMMIDAWSHLATKKNEPVPEDLAMSTVSKAKRLYAIAA